MHHSVPLYVGSANIKVPFDMSLALLNGCSIADLDFSNIL
jgi:hypothetical protein